MQVLCTCDEIAEDHAKGITLNGSAYIIIRRDAQYYAYKNRCPHLGIPLEWQPDQFLDEDGELIRCSTHGALFEIETGFCVAGPCAGQALTSVPIKVSDNCIFLGP